MAQTLLIPQTQGIADILNFCATLKNLPEEGELEIDFSCLNHTPPFKLLVLSSCFERLRTQRPKLKLLPRNYHLHRYAGHMGFFKAFGVEYGRAPGEAHGSDRYLPITVQLVRPIKEEAAEQNRPVAELVQEEARQLAHILSQSKNGYLFDVLEYSLREILRNTYEHSRSYCVEWCAQYWPAQDKVEIAILDRGIGIESSLRSNPALTIQDSRHAVNLALLPGISRNVYPGAPIARGLNIWQNSGFGLYLTSRLCRVGGNFFIGSSGEGIYLKDDAKTYMPFPTDGTAVRMILRPSRIRKFGALLQQFSDEGEKIAAQMNISLPVASTASRMVRTDFGRIKGL